MFGYIYPNKNELKYKHIREYRTCYCGVCYGIRSNFGLIRSSLLQYECVFLYIFLSAIASDKLEKVEFRCPLNIFTKRTGNYSKRILEFVSFINIFLVECKLVDDYKDEKKFTREFLRRIIIHNKRYKEKKLEYGELVEKITNEINKLSQYEKEKEKDIDLLLITQGNILKFIVESFIIYEKIYMSESQRNICSQVAFQIGEWIYLMDAFDDLEKDHKKGQYNPLLQSVDAFDIQLAKDKGCIILNLISMNIKRIFNELSMEKHKEIVENIIYFGLDLAVDKCRLKNKEIKNNECNSKREN